MRIGVRVIPLAARFLPAVWIRRKRMKTDPRLPLAGARIKLFLLTASVALAIAGTASATVNGPVVFINEIHYNDSNPSNAFDFVEIAGPAGTDLSSYRVYDYHPDGQVSGSITLSGVIPNQNNGFGTVSFNFATPGSSVGNPRGFALVH